MKGVATLADIELMEEIPLDTRDLPANTYAALQRGANKKPDKIALQFFLQGTNYKDAVFYTYKDLMALITQTANMFHALGIGKGDVVSMILPNLPQAYFTIWGGQAAGIVNPIDPLLDAQVMANIMNAAGTKVLVTLAPFPASNLWQKVASIANQVPTLETILKVDIGYYLGFFQRVGLGFLNLRADKGPKLAANVQDFGLTARQHSGEKLAYGRIIRPDDMAAYFHTGGTANTPKLAQHTHFNEVFAAWSLTMSIGLEAKNIVYCGLPLFHANSVIATGLVPWMQGASVVLGTPAGYRADGVIPNFWGIVEHYGLNFFSGEPTIFSALLTVPHSEYDISSLQFALGSAAPMPVEVFNQFEESTSARMLEGYALTEGACFSSVNPIEGERRVGSIGLRLPYQDMRVVVLAADGRYERDCRPNEPGAIVVRGPNVFKGYLEEAHNQKVWINTGDGGGGWFNTGDKGWQDAEGYFWLSGTKENVDDA